MLIDNELEVKLLASHWLSLWADCLRVREAGEETPLRVEESRAPYAKGAPNVKEYRPKDDPDPMFFVFAQVEYCLGSREGVLWQFAKHVWLERKNPEEFRHMELKSGSRGSCYNFKDRLLARLGNQIRLTSPRWICKEKLMEARQRARAERQMKVSRTMEDYHRERKSSA